MKISKKSFFQDSQDLQNGEKKEAKWDRKMKIRKKMFQSLKNQMKNLKKIKLSKKKRLKYLLIKFKKVAEKKIAKILNFV